MNVAWHTSSWERLSHVERAVPQRARSEFCSTAPPWPKPAQVHLVLGSSCAAGAILGRH